MIVMNGELFLRFKLLGKASRVASGMVRNSASDVLECGKGKTLLESDGFQAPPPPLDHSRVIFCLNRCRYGQAYPHPVSGSGVLCDGAGQPRTACLWGYRRPQGPG